MRRSPRCPPGLGVWKVAASEGGGGASLLHCVLAHGRERHGADPREVASSPRGMPEHPAPVPRPSENRASPEAWLKAGESGVLISQHESVFAWYTKQKPASACSPGARCTSHARHLAPATRPCELSADPSPALAGEGTQTARSPQLSPNKPQWARGVSFLSHRL